MEAAKEKTELFTCGEYVMRNVKPLHGIGHSEHVFEFKESEKGSVEKFVKSVNNHDLLVEALKGSLQMMEQSLIYRKANGLTNNTMLEATIEKAREALSKAE